MSDSKLGILIEARNNAAKTINQVKTEIAGIGQSADGVVGALGNLGAAFGAIAGGAALLAIGNAVKDLALLGAQAERIGTSFRTLAGSAGVSADEMLTALRKASQGTITDTDLMLNANRAMMMGVTTDAAQMARLLEVAAVRGRAMGRSTAEAFNDIVTGIGRMSPLILDNLGIVTGGEAALKAYAESLGKTADALTDTERRQMLVNKVLADIGTLARDSQTEIDGLGVAWENLRAAMGQEVVAHISLLGVPEFLQAQADIITARRKVADAFREAGVTELQQAVGVTDLAGKTAFPLIPDAALRAQREAIEAVLLQYQDGKLSLEEFTARVNAGVGALATYTQQSRDAATALAFLNERHNVLNPQMSAAEALAARLGQQYLATGGNATAAAAGVATLGNAVIAISGKFMTAADRARAFGEAIKGIAASGTSELLGVAETMAAKSGADQAYQAYQQWVTGLDAVIAQAQAEHKTLEEVTLAKAAYIATTRNSVSAIGQEKTAVEAYNRSLDDLRSTIDSLVSASVGSSKNLVDFSPTGGFDPNGPARDFGRMWDVAVNGFRSQWLDELRAQGLIPDDVIAAGEEKLKSFAESKARAFQAGSDLGLLDVGQIVDQVKAAMAAKAEMQRVEAQVLAALGTQGISGPEAKVAVGKVLGTTDTGAQGRESGQQFQAGFAAGVGTTGAKMMESLAASMKQQAAALLELGKASGTTFASGFAATAGDLPGWIIDMLAGKIGPAVQRWLNDQRSRTGAPP